MAQCDDCQRWWHVREACIHFLAPLERKLFVRRQRQTLEDRNSTGPGPFVCCSRRERSSSDIFDEY